MCRNVLVQNSIAHSTPSIPWHKCHLNVYSKQTDKKTAQGVTSEHTISELVVLIELHILAQIIIRQTRCAHRDFPPNTGATYSVLRPDLEEHVYNISANV